MRARRAGAVAGVEVGLGANLLGAVVVLIAAALWGLRLADVAPGAVAMGIVVCLTGAIVGSLAGPSGWGDPRRLSNRALVLRMAVLAVVVGGLLSGLALALWSLPLGAESAPDLVVRVVFFGCLFGIWGIVIFGWLVLPLTATAAAAWIIRMAAFLERAESRPAR